MKVKLDSPTVGDLIEALGRFPKEEPFRIYWPYSARFTIQEDEEYREVFLKGDDS